MAIITYSDLRYKRDKLYHDKIVKALEKLKVDQPRVNSFLTESLSSFYKLLSAAIRVDNHPNVKMILKAISEKYDTDQVMHVFLYEASTPKALCTNRSYVEKGVIKSELIVLVSQHFFNNLDFQQQISVLSHELCHKLLGHTDLPAKRILESDIDLSSRKDLRLDLIKWMICAEVSSDIFALHASNYKPKVFSTSIIQYASGVYALDTYDFIDILIKQYDDLADRLISQDLTPHPILPLRIKIIQEVCDDEIIDKIGKIISREEKRRLITNFNQKIDNLIFAVYPEIFEEGRSKHSLLYFNLGAAVMLADHEISPEEESHFLSIEDEKISPGVVLKDIKEQIKQLDYDKVIVNLLNESLKYCKTQKITTSEVIPIIRFMLLTAASDGVQAKELSVVYRFAKHFKISKEEIVILLNQVLS
jgi:hypothetical protein